VSLFEKRSAAGVRRHLGSIAFPDFRDVRKIICEFTRNPERGLPSGSLHMQLEWYPKLLVKEAMRRAFKTGSRTCIVRQSQHVHQKDRLPAKALVDVNMERGVIDAALRVRPSTDIKLECRFALERNFHDSLQRIRGLSAAYGRECHSLMPETMKCQPNAPLCRDMTAHSEAGRLYGGGSSPERTVLLKSSAKRDYYRENLSEFSLGSAAGESCTAFNSRGF
jgi:hypothetical protein